MPSPDCQSVYAPRSAPSAGRHLGPVERLQLLAREGERDRAALALHRDPPRHRRLVRVAGAHVPEVRDRPERHVVLDGLVRRAVLADADRVVRPDPERLHVPERREPDGRPHVVGEDQEGGAVGLQHPVGQPDPVHDRAHRVLADAEGDVAAGVRLREEAGALELGLRRLDEIRCAADHRRREGLQRLHHRLAGVAAGDRLAGRELRQRLDPARPRLAGAIGVPLLLQPRERLRPALEPLLPLLLPLDPLRAHVHVLVDLGCDVEVLVRIEPERLLRRRDLRLAERRAVRLGGVDRLRRPVGDVAADDDQRRRVLDGLRRPRRALDRVDVLRVGDRLHVPALRLEALRLVLGRERERRWCRRS